jgi:hypothetical protein
MIDDIAQSNHDDVMDCAKQDKPGQARTSQNKHNDKPGQAQ